MVVITNDVCTKCHKLKQIISSAGQINTVCAECQLKEANEQRRAHFAELDAMSLEDRVRRIEEWIYNYKPYTGPTAFG